MRENQSGDKTEHSGEDEAINDFDPFASVNTLEAALHGDRRAGYARNERVAFAGGNAEHPRSRGPDHNGKKSGMREEA